MTLYYSLTNKINAGNGKSRVNLSESISRESRSRGLRQSSQLRRFSITLQKYFPADLTLTDLTLTDLTLSPNTFQHMSSHEKPIVFSIHNILFLSGL